MTAATSPTADRPALRGTILALFSALAFGLATPLVQRFGHGVGSFATAALLYTGAAVVGLVTQSKAEAELRREHLRRIVWIAVLGAGLAPAALAWGLARTSGPEVSGPGDGGRTLSRSQGRPSVTGLLMGVRASPGLRHLRTRRPELSALHVIVRKHLETFLACVREERGKELPRYVVEELQRYLRCGILAHGFLRVVCSTCGQEIVVGYSCKCRGACPSCSARRMCDVACHLCDHVLPDTPMRQWVLTAPYEVRRVMALRPDAVTACHRIFVTEIAKWQKASSGLAGAQTGSVTFVQRFHATLGSFVHFHVV